MQTCAKIDLIIIDNAKNMTYLPAIRVVIHNVIMSEKLYFCSVVLLCN